MSSSNNSSTIEQNLSEIRDSLQREGLKEELSDAADTLETIVLLQKLDQELYDPEDEHRLSEESVVCIRSVRETLQEGDLDELDSAVTTLEDRLSSEQRAVTQRLSSKIDKDLNKISAMNRLNDRVEKVDDTRIAALRDQVSDCQNLDFITAESLDVKFDEVEREAASIETEFEELQQTIFGDFYGTPLEDSIRRLLDDEALRLDALSMKDIERLKNANFADCLELVLS